MKVELSLVAKPLMMGFECLILMALFASLKAQDRLFVSNALKISFNLFLLIFLFVVLIFANSNPNLSCLRAKQVGLGKIEFVFW